MSEFHGYALRKHTMRCYTSVLAWQDTLTSHPFYQRACRGVLTIYLHLLDCPEDTDGLGHLTTVLPSYYSPPPPLPLLPSVLPSRRCCCTNTLRHTIVMPQAERKKERARIKKLREKEKKVTPFPSQPHTEWHSNTCPHISSYPLQFRTHSLYIYSTGCRSEGASSNRRGQMERRETPFGRPGQRSRPSGGSVRGAESSGNVFDGGCCVV